MSDILELQSRTHRLGLPNLFPGQAQKEFFVNEAFARLDTLIHPVVEGESSAAPPAPTDGECWIVSSGAIGEWAGRDQTLAGYQAGSWIFVEPVQGMRLWDRFQSRLRIFDGVWRDASNASLPSGGAVIDTEARAAIEEIMEALQTFGVLSKP